MIQLLTGDCRTLLRTLPDASVHCVVTSPPYYGLRDYGTAQWEGGDAGCDHAFVPDAGTTSQRVGRSYQQGHVHRECRCGARRIDAQIGLEATPDAYIATMVQVFREVKRVMRPDATLWMNLGDNFANKQLQMMPARVALALQADGWFLRSSIIWAKPNPMPEGCRDRPTSAHEHIFLLTKRCRYFYDADAVREPVQEWNTPIGRENAAGIESQRAIAREQLGALAGGRGWKVAYNNPAGRNLRNVWTIATHAFPAAHFATFPPELAGRCIRAGTSERGCCAQCGKLWVRESESRIEHTQRIHTHPKYGDDGQYQHQAANRHADGHIPGRKVSTTTGWQPGCQCNVDTVPCTVLDPFSGAGTALLVADRLGRDAIGIDLSHQYVEMSRERLVADCPLFADLSPAPPQSDAYDRDMADLFAPLAAD